MENPISNIRGTLTISSELSEVGRARDWISELAQQAGISSKLSYELQLVLSEACTNCIKHAYDMAEGHTVELAFSIDDSQICVVVRDYGRKINLDFYREPDLDVASVGGYGIFLMRQLMDEVKFDTSCDVGTELTLIKRVSPAVSPQE